MKPTQGNIDINNKDYNRLYATP